MMTMMLKIAMTTTRRTSTVDTRKHLRPNKKDIKETVINSHVSDRGEFKMSSCSALNSIPIQMNSVFFKYSLYPTMGKCEWKLI